MRKPTLTAANNARLQKLLAQRVRYEGQIMTEQEMLDKGGYYKPAISHNIGGRQMYVLRNDQGHSMEVAKLIHDHYAANPPA